MKRLLLIPVSLLLTGAAFAQTDTAHHREVYSAINKSAGSMQKVAAVVPAEPAEITLHAWVEDTTIRKIVATIPGEHGIGTEEYYFENGEPLFVYTVYTTVDPESGKEAARVENRHYFRDGEMFKWLDEEKNPVPPGSADFSEMAASLRNDSARFLQAFTAPLPSRRTATGTFTGIEEGDYAHWNMRTADGEDLSFFILDPDPTIAKVLADPGSRTGRKCRVALKETIEDIPEAGGKVPVTQILSVEWLE